MRLSAPVSGGDFLAESAEGDQVGGVQHNQICNRKEPQWHCPRPDDWIFTSSASQKFLLIFTLGREEIQ